MNIKRKEVFTLAEDSGFAMGYALGQDSGNNCNSGGMFGGGSDGWWGIILLALLFGWGGNGGFGGRSNGACATQADLAAGFNNSTVLSSLDDIKLGQANAINYNNQGFSGLNTALMNGFHGVDNAVCTLGHQLSDCCCTTQRAIDGVNYNMAKGFCDLGNVINMQTRDIIDNQNANAKSLMDFMVNSKIEALTNENNALRLSASQHAQNQYLIEQLRPAPVPAFPVSAPYCFGGYSGYNTSGCGCGCG